MVPVKQSQKSVLTGRFFRFQVALAVLCASSLAAANNCVPPRTGLTDRIVHIIDGDTVVLEQTGHVRLIGIDTPELDHENGAHQPGAVAARNYLRKLLKSGTQVGLVLDIERQDHHGRTLAHLFLDGTNVQAELLSRGLGVPLTWPPNLEYLDCYRTAAATARLTGKGLWQRARYQTVQAGTLAHDQHGYRVVPRGGIRHE